MKFFYVSLEEVPDDKQMGFTGGEKRIQSADYYYYYINLI